MAQRAAGFVIFRRYCDDINYLLLRASYGDCHWSAPKAYVEEGADDFTTALRVTKEKTGYDEDDLIIYKDVTKTLNYQVQGKPKTVVYWLAELIEPLLTPNLTEEHPGSCWSVKDEAKAIIGFKDYQQMLDEFHEIIFALKT